MAISPEAQADINALATEFGLLYKKMMANKARLATMDSKYAAIKVEQQAVWQPAIDDLSQLSGLNMWLRPETLTGASGSEVMAWQDSSPAGVVVTNSDTATSRPALVTGAYGSLSAVQFRGGQFLSAKIDLGGDTQTIVSVVKPQSVAAGTLGTVISGNTAGTLDVQIVSGVPHVVNTTTKDWGAATAPVGSDRFYVLAVTYSKTANTSTVWIDGTKVGTFDTTGANLTASTSNASRIGHRIFSSGEGFTGLIGELGHYNRVLTDQEIFDASQMLLSKFTSLQLASPTPITSPVDNSNPPTTNDPGIETGTAYVADSRYEDVIAGLSPLVWFPLQEEDPGAAVVTTSDGLAVTPVGTVYSNDSWDATYNNEPPHALGRFAHTYVLGGVDDHYLPLAGRVQQLTTMAQSGEWSFTEWLRPASAGWQQCVFALRDDAGNKISLHLNRDDPTKVELVVRDKSVFGVMPSSGIGVWRQYGVTISGGVARLYADGVEIGSGAVPAWTTTITKGWIGSYGAGGAAPFYGSFTHPCFHSIALTGAQQAEVNTAGREPVYYRKWHGRAPFEGLDAHWRNTPGASALIGKEIVPIWWSSLEDGFPQIWQEEALAGNIGMHINPNQLVSIKNYEAVGMQVWVDYKNMPGGSEPTIKDYSAMVAANPAMFSLRVFGDEWDNFYATSAEMDAEIAKATNVPGGLFINQGTGVTQGARHRFAAKTFYSHQRLAATATDLYFGCMSDEILRNLQVQFGPTDYPTARKPIMYAYLQRLLHGVLGKLVPTLTAIAEGHANMNKQAGDNTSVPAADENEAAAAAGVLGGNVGHYLFPQGFAGFNDTTSPVWNAQTTYPYRSQVKDPDDGSHYFWARRDVPQGLDPRTDTSGTYWLSWRGLNGMHAVNPREHAQGMGDAVKRMKAMQVHIRPFVDGHRVRVNAHKDLWSVLWPNVGGRAYLMTMQDRWRDSGTYSIKLPAEAAGATVTVEWKLGGKPPAGTTRTASVNDATFSETFNSPSDFFLYSWPVDQTPDGSQRTLIAHIGDSLSSDAEHMNGDPATFILNRYKQIAGFAAGKWDGRWGRYIYNPAPGDTRTTVDIIREFRANGNPEPKMWAIFLGTNMQCTPEQQAALDTSADVNAAKAVLAELGPDANVLWMGVCASGTPSNAYHKKLNQDLQALVEARGVHGRFIDYMAHLQAKPGMDWSAYGTYFSDYTHLTLAGYTDRYDLAGREADAMAVELGI